MKQTYLRSLLPAFVSIFFLAVVGLCISLYETSGPSYREYLYHCGGPGTTDRLSCIAVYHRNKSFYEIILKASLPFLLISGPLIALSLLQKPMPRHSS